MVEQVKEQVKKLRRQLDRSAVARDAVGEAIDEVRTEPVDADAKAAIVRGD